MFDNWVVIEYHEDRYGRTEHWFTTYEEAWEYIFEHENDLPNGRWFDTPRAC